MVHLARVQGGQQIQTGDIWLIFRGFEFAAQRRNRVRGAVSGWARVTKTPLFDIAVPAMSTSYGPMGVPFDSRSARMVAAHLTSFIPKRQQVDDGCQGLQLSDQFVLRI
jgi:hypothetical protein